MIFKLQLQNTGTKNWTSPTIVDTFPATLQYDAVQPFPNGQFDFDPNGTTLTTDPVATPASGLVTFQWGAGDDLAPGQTAVPLHRAQGHRGHPCGDADQQHLWASPISVARSAAARRTTGHTGFDPNHPTQKYCTDDETITVKQSRGLSSLKQIKGDRRHGPDERDRAGWAVP